MSLTPTTRWLSLALALLLASVCAHAMDADQLMRNIDEMWRGETSKATMSMAVKTQHYERNMTMDAWSRGKDYSLIVIREPIKDRGIATLKVQNNIWNYLPKINRVTKIPSSMMSGSWMGSHFTNDDLVKENTFQDDYNSKITFEGERGGRQVYEVTSVAKPDAAVVWGKVVTQIDQKNLAPFAADFYDEQGKLMRKIGYDQVKTIGKRIVPMRMSLQPMDKPSESTVVTYDDIEFGVPLEASFFSLQSLQQRR